MNNTVVITGCGVSNQVECLVLAMLSGCDDQLAEAGAGSASGAIGFGIAPPYRRSRLA